MSAGSPDFERLRGDAELAVYIDLKSPYAFLAIEPTRDMARAAGVAIDWRPFTLDIPSYLGSARLDAKGRVAESDRTPQQWTGIRHAYREARHYAKLRDRTLRGTEKIWDSSGAGVAMLWAKRQGPERLDRFLDAAYERFWRRDLDVERPEVLEALLRETGAEVAGFAEWERGPGRRALGALEGEAFAAGLFGVPSYVVGDELWWGREHLPRVEWLLRGRPGPAPDVAYRSFRR